MYQNSNVAEDAAIAAAAVVITRDRAFYDPFFRVVEQYAAANGYIGGENGILLLTSDVKTKDSYQYEIYTHDGYFQIRDFVNDLYNKIHSEYDGDGLNCADTISLSTVIKHQEFQITMNDRRLVRILTLPSGMKPGSFHVTSRPGLFADVSLKCIPHELQLTSVYKKLYTPSAVEEWEKYYQYESELYNRVEKTITGGMMKPGEIISASAKLPRILSRADCVIVGETAMESLGLVAAKDRGRLQVLSDRNIDEIVEMISQYYKKQANRGREIATEHVTVSSVEQDVAVLGDFQLRKWSVYYISESGARVFLVDVYNSPSYELIPFKIAGELRVGSWWVLLRFWFIDLWVFKNVALRTQTNLGVVRSYIEKIKRNISICREQLFAEMQKDAAGVFQQTNYAGINIPDNVALRKVRSMLPPYNPAAATVLGGSEPEIIQYTIFPVPAQQVNVEIDVETKCFLLEKIAKTMPEMKTPAGVLGVLNSLAERANSGSQQWVQDKSNRALAYGLEFYRPYISGKFLDIGCGAGQLRAVIGVTPYESADYIGADIVDHFIGPKSRFVLLSEGVKCNIPDGVINCISIFHVLHHARDFRFRVADCYRMLKPGGYLFVKDHDVRNSIIESNVTFEHLVYDLDRINNLDLARYTKPPNQLEYYSLDAVTGIMAENGFQLVNSRVRDSLTEVFDAVYRKI